MPEIDISGSVQDIMPLANQIWLWASAHYITIMIFVIAIVALVIFGKRRKRAN